MPYRLPKLPTPSDALELPIDAQTMDIWTVMSTHRGDAPTGAWREPSAELRGIEAFKLASTKAALTRFGSGWAWLSVDAAGKLAVVSSGNQDSPIMAGIGLGTSQGLASARGNTRTT